MTNLSRAHHVLSGQAKRIATLNTSQSFGLNAAALTFGHSAEDFRPHTMLTARGARSACMVGRRSAGLLGAAVARYVQ